MKSLLAVLLIFSCVVPIWADQVSALPKNKAVVTRIRFYPAPGHEKDLVGGKFLGSNTSKADGFVELAEIKDQPQPNQWTELTFPNTTVYRWVKYAGAPGSFGRMAKLEFYDDQVILKGEPFGIYPDGWRRLFDGQAADPKSWYQGEVPDGQFYGLDLRDLAALPWPNVDPGQGVYTSPITVKLRSIDPEAVIRYTIDGTIPTSTNGQVYSAPIPVDKTTNISAVAFPKDGAPSPVCYNPFIIGALTHRDSFHVGNSLTGITGRYEFQARSAGVDHRPVRYLLGGGLTKALWNAAFLDIGDPNDKEGWIKLYTTHLGDTIMYRREEIENTKKEWTELWPKVPSTISDFTLQPRDFDIDEEADYDNRWLALVQGKAPDVQPWLYIEWDEIRRQRPTDQAKLPSSEMKTLMPLLTWQESMGGMILYGEDLKRKVEETYKGKKPIRIIPAALAMGWMDNMIENGQVPGFAKTDFHPKLFSDGVHPNVEGSYLVDCCWYASFFGESPEGKFLPVITELSPQQAQVMQHLAWDVVKNYPYSGYYEEGTTPCEKPQISPVTTPITDHAPVTLTSATPGAWFRYTLDGTTPTRTTGYIYCGTISVLPGMTVKAIAYKSGMADSGVTEATFAGDATK